MKINGVIVKSFRPATVTSERAKYAASDRWILFWALAIVVMVGIGAVFVIFVSL